MKKLIAFVMAVAILASLAGCTPEQAPAVAAPVALEQAFQNTWDAIVAGKSFTITVDSLDTNYEAGRKYLYSGYDESFSCEMKVYMDKEAKELSLYGYTVTNGQMNTVMVQDGWMGFYDEYDGRFYKKNISEKLDKLFAGELSEALMDEDELEDLEEDVDQEKLRTLWKEKVATKLNDTQWLKDNCAYTTVTEGTTVKHILQPDFEAVMEELAADLEDAFDKQAYKDLTGEIKDLDNEMTTKVILTQRDNMITGLEVEALVPEDEVTNTFTLSISIENIGTTQIDPDMQTEILEKLKEYTDTSGYLGKTRNDVYTNEYLGITADLSDWELATEDETAQMAGVTGFDNYYVEPVLYAVNTDGKSSLSVMVEESTSSSRTMDEQAYMNYGAKSIQYSMESAGFKRVKVTSETVEFAGEEHVILRVSASYNGQTIRQTVAVLRTEEYVYNITFITDDFERADELMTIFKPIE